MDNDVDNDGDNDNDKPDGLKLINDQLLFKHLSNGFFEWYDDTLIQWC